MATLTALFGDELKSKDGMVSTVDALANKAAVFVYFSAHWCPPCRGFTPKLSEFHTRHAVEKNFQTVFVSNDVDEATFNEYFGEMPWLALPYDKRDIEAALSKKFKVQGIPMLIILGPDGKVITTEGLSNVMENFEDCKGFPWTPMTFSEALGDSFVRQDGTTVGKEAIAGETLGIYFSAHWSPSCRGFTPKLKDFYAAYKAKDPGLEVVFVSSDKSEDEMISYFKNDHGDYLALPFAKRAEKGELSKRFGVEGIPTFVIVSPEGEVINANARGKVMAGAEAVLAQGWFPPAVGDLAEGVEAGGTDINKCPTVVITCEGCGEAVAKSCREAMEPLAKKYIEEGKAAGEDPKCIFLLDREGDRMLKRMTEPAAGEELEQMTGKPTGDQAFISSKLGKEKRRKLA